MAIVLNDGYLLEGDAGTTATIDYTVSGLDGTTLTMLVSGQLADAKATLYTASGVDTIAGITLFNTGSAMAVNLYVNDGTSRQILGIDSLGAGFHATYDGKTLSVYDENGSLQIETTALAHAVSHTDGSDDIQDAQADDSTKGIATFEADDFDDSSGKIDLATSVCKSLDTDGDAITPSTHVATIAGGTGITTSGAGSTVTITGDDASTTAKGIAEIAIAAEINIGNDTGRVISPKELSDSNYGKRIMYIKCLAFDTAVAVADELAYVTIPIELNGMNLVLAHAAVYTKSSGGLPEITLERSVDQGSNWTDMLSTSITIDVNEFSSYTANTAPVIDGGQDDVATGYWIRVNVDTAGTGTKGLDCILTFQLP